MTSSKKFSYLDCAILLLIVISVAFYDIKIIFIISQILSILFTIPILLKGATYNKGAIIQFALWAITFITYSLLSVFWASDENQTAISTVLSTIQVVLISISLIVYCDGKKRRTEKVLNYFIIAAAILVFRFLITVPISFWGDGERFSKENIFGSNIPAMTLAYASVILFWKYIHNRKVDIKQRKNIFNIILIIIFMSVTLLMGTKKSILIFLVGSIIVMLTNSKSPVKSLKILACSAILIVVGYTIIKNVPILYNSIGYRIDDFILEMSGDNADNIRSTAMRKKFIEEAFQIYSEYPVLGVGQDGFRYRNIYEKTYSHCNYAELMANLGSIGIVVFYSIYVIIFMDAQKSKTRDLVFAIIFSMLLADIATVSYSMELNYVLLGIVFGTFNDNTLKKENYEKVEAN